MDCANVNDLTGLVNDQKITQSQYDGKDETDPIQESDKKEEDNRSDAEVSQVNLHAEFN